MNQLESHDSMEEESRGYLVNPLILQMRKCVWGRVISCLRGHGGQLWTPLKPFFQVNLHPSQWRGELLSWQGSEEKEKK